MILLLWKYVQKRPSRWQRWGPWWLLWMPLVVQGAEPFEAFLEALRQERYFDTALAYLDRMESSPDTPPPLRQQIPLERARLARSAAEQESDFGSRLRFLEKASKDISAVATESSEPEFQADVAVERWEILGAIADQWLARAVAKNGAGTDENARSKADEAITQARTAALASVEQLRVLLKEMQDRPRERQDVALRDRWRTDFIAAQMSVPGFTMKSAQLVEGDEPEYRKRLKEAADAFGQLSEKYGRTPYYLPLLVKRGQCHQLLREHQDALSFYGEVLENAPLPAALSALATQLSMECWSSKEEGKSQKAVDQGEAWLRSHASEAIQVTAPVRLALVKAMQARSEASGKTRENDLARAKQLLSQIIRGHAPQAAQAHELLASLRTGDTSTPNLDGLASFSEAKLEADAVLSKAQASESGIGLIRSRLEQIKDPQEQAALQQEIDEAQRGLRSQYAEASALYRRALDLASPGDSLDDVNRVRYLLGYLQFQQEDYYDCAVLSEFLARHFSDGPTARASARLALGAYYKLFESGGTKSPFATDHLIDVARYTALRWPNDEEGQAAALTLIRFLISQGRITDAQDYLAQLPEKSQLRAEAELATGTALVREFLKAKGERSAGAAPDPELARLKEAARQLLRDGLQGRGSGPATSTSVVASLALAQLALDDRDAAAAIDILQEPGRGPWTLLTAGDPATADPAIREDVYRTALRAQLFASMNGSPAARPTDDIAKILKELKVQFGDSEQGRARAVAMYVGLARDLKEQVAEADPAKQGAGLDSFVTVLEGIASNSKDPDILHWVARTYQELADGAASQGPAAVSKATGLLDHASQILQELLKSPDMQSDAKRRLQMEMALASLKRRQKDYSAAIPLFVSVLKDNPNLLNVQKDAAYTYQEGQAYTYAIKGGRPDPKTSKNIIWGWEKIGNVVARQMRRDPSMKEKFGGIFHEARWNVASCRYQEALTLEGEKRLRYLEQARQAITATTALYPDLGGPTWKTKYEQLKGDIDQAIRDASPDGPSRGDT